MEVKGRQPPTILHLSAKENVFSYLQGLDQCWIDNPVNPESKNIENCFALYGFYVKYYKSFVSLEQFLLRIRTQVTSHFAPFLK